MDPIARAVMADLGKTRQDELPLSTEARRISFVRPKNDESQCYDPQVKRNLRSKWSVVIEDEESEQMRGLTNLSTRPWASSGPPKSSVFSKPKLPAPANKAKAPSPKPNPTQPVPPPAPAPTPAVTESQLIDVALAPMSEKAAVDVEAMLEKMALTFRAAYFQLTSSWENIMVADGGQAGDTALNKRPPEGLVDFKAEASRQCLVNMMRFIEEERIKLSRTTREPLMSTQTLEALQALDSGLVSSKSEPKSKVNEGGGLSNSIWAK